METSPHGAMPEETLGTTDGQKILGWIAALCAADLDYRLSREGNGWALHVPPAQAVAARMEIEACEQDTLIHPATTAPAREARPSQPRTWSVWWAAAFLAAVYVWLGAYNPDNPLCRTAAADAEAIRAGEWWRSITALTLHADAAHLAGNLVCLVLLGQSVCRVFGKGMGWIWILASGAGGNAAAAWLLKTDSVSVGASTACFGAIGLLAASALAQRLRAHRLSLQSGTDPLPSRRNSVWIPLGAGIALLAILGTGPRSDLAGHAMGFLAGCLLALPASCFDTERIPGWIQRAAQMLCLLVVLFAWKLAVTSVFSR